MCIRDRDWVATVPPTVKLASAAFDKQRGAMIFGWIFACHQLGGAAAAYGAGLTRTLLLTYSPAVYAAVSYTHLYCTGFRAP